MHSTVLPLSALNAHYRSNLLGECTSLPDHVVLVVEVGGVSWVAGAVAAAVAGGVAGAGKSAGGAVVVGEVTVWSVVEGAISPNELASTTHPLKLCLSFRR